MTSLGYAILGLLAREPMSGYDVARQLKVPVGYFWTASHSQIYPELDALEREGLVGHRVVPQKARPDKKVFAITAHGRQALAAWLAEPVEPPPLRDELMLKTYSSWLLDRERAVAFFRGEQARFAAELEQFEQIERDAYGGRAAQPGSRDFASYATLRAGIAIKRASAAWCAWIATSLEAGVTPAPRGRRTSQRRAPARPARSPRRSTPRRA